MLLSCIHTLFKTCLSTLKPTEIMGIHVLSFKTVGSLWTWLICCQWNLISTVNHLLPKHFRVASEITHCFRSLASSEMLWHIGMKGQEDSFSFLMTSKLVGLLVMVLPVFYMWKCFQRFSQVRFNHIPHSQTQHRTPTWTSREPQQKKKKR